MTIRVIAIDDHPLIIKALTDLLKGHPDIELVGTDNRGSQLLSLVREKKPDVVILDLGIPGDSFDPISKVRLIREQFPKIKIIILTGYDDGLWARELVKAGANGYILKSDDFSLSIPKAVHTVCDGYPFFSPPIAKLLLDNNAKEILTERELSVVVLIAKGFSTQAVAENLGVSEKRVRNLLVQICDKLEVIRTNDVDLRIALINKARKLGLLPNDLETK